MNLQRYDFDEFAVEHEHEEGDWVKAANAAALVAKLEGERDSHASTRDMQWGQIQELRQQNATLRARVSELTTELGQVAEARDAAERFASKVERGEVKFAKVCDENLQRIAAMPLGKKPEENLSDAVARVLSERDNFRAEVERLRGALERAETSMTRYCNGLHANGSDDMALEVVRKALTAAPVATEGWMPIESAPKDGTRPIMIAQFNKGELIDIDFNAKLVVESESWEMPQKYYVWMTDHGRVEVPTHWAYMLPPPPAQEGGEGK